MPVSRLSAGRFTLVHRCRHRSRGSTIDIAIVIFDLHIMGLINQLRATPPSPSTRATIALPPRAAARPVVDSTDASPPRADVAACCCPCRCIASLGSNVARRRPSLRRLLRQQCCRLSSTLAVALHAVDSIGARLMLVVFSGCPSSSPTRSTTVTLQWRCRGPPS